MDSPKGTTKKFGGVNEIELTFDYGEWPHLINPADNMGWDLVLVPSAKKEDKNLTPVGYVVYNDDSELWQREVGKEPPANIIDNTKIILAPNGSATPGDKKLINDFFDKLWQIKQVIWKEV